ncbi:hypothetical protein HN371_01775 [Candidatus Poribacteria bacterium]|nr:hypothetical protein [Candidatus Poribacteria bacterium]MBT5534599.1 hypothetical protein [Candidatus Poribacteria bacterium]MBT5713963.1 hypothetical protein [Candidatus Poribacteria bacterium]MBT7807724.1 hypothetical protein [Candidatus Poribacteria bacterium]
MIRRWAIACGLAAVVGAGAVGCGGSSPTGESFSDFANVDGDVVLNVGVLVEKTTAGPGDIIELSATVDAVRAEAVTFSWVNVTGHGRLVGAESGVVSGPFTIQWEAPSDVETGSVKVEVVQLVVTAISQVISVSETGVQTSHDIASETRTIPITITATP